MSEDKAEYGRDITFYAGEFACQFQAVTSKKNVKTVNITLSKKQDGKFFANSSKLTIQLNVIEMIELAKVFMRWSKVDLKFSAGYHGINKNKILYINTTLNDENEIANYNVQLHDKSNQNIPSLIMFLPVSSRFEIVQILLERISLNANSTITDTLNILKIMDRKY